MNQIASMLAAHPVRRTEMKAIVRGLDATLTCAAVCSICADACLSEEMAKELAECIRLDIACSAICFTTAALLTKVGQEGPQPLQAQLAVCVNACRECAEECRRHSAMHEHCRICAEACEACNEACENLLKSMRHAGESEGAKKHQEAARA